MLPVWRAARRAPPRARAVRGLQSGGRGRAGRGSVRPPTASSAASPQRAEPALPWAGGPPSADVGSEHEVVRGGGQHRPAAASIFLPLSLHAPGGGARTSRRPAVFLARPPSSAGRSGVPRQPAARTASAQPRGRCAQAQRPELAPRLSACLLRRRGARERRVAAARGETSQAVRGVAAQVAAPRRWSPSSGSGWPTRSTARTSPSVATSPKPREMRPKKRHL